MKRMGSLLILSVFFIQGCKATSKAPWLVPQDDLYVSTQDQSLGEAFSTYLNLVDDYFGAGGHVFESKNDYVAFPYYEKAQIGKVFNQLCENRGGLLRSDKISKQTPYYNYGKSLFCDNPNKENQGHIELVESSQKFYVQYWSQQDLEDKAHSEKQKRLNVYRDDYSKSNNLASLSRFIKKYESYDPENLIDKAKDRISEIKSSIALKEEKARLRNIEKTHDFREKLQTGSESHCGIVVEVKDSIAKIQTSNGLMWLKIDELYPKYVSGCSIVNGTYVHLNPFII